ncbi:uncharacterized protein LOC122512004 [Leptopilina heterotoma]|uniref:uncharacterized protein LOC122512004 n=1 Tax=Leptopilina heterotoma TaxID=63436 RepID=UPI001CA98404|nr:uncharacterized protein LOC122512004 [Leptopilina heterotoma]
MDMDVQLGKGLWRISGQEWHTFPSDNGENSTECIFAESAVFKKLASAGLVVNPDKCKFGCSRVTYLGYVLDKDGLRPDSEKVAPVLEYPAPLNIKQLRRFLGMAFQTLKKKLVSAPVLARLDFTKPFTDQCDASDSAIRAVLTQESEDGEHPIVYASKAVIGAERNYSVTERECLALLWAIKKFRPYLKGYRFKAITDHSAQRWLRYLKDPSGRLVRWALEMQQCDFDIVHRRGVNHHVPDALSHGWWKTNRHGNDPLLLPVTDKEQGWKLVILEEHRNRILKDANFEIAASHLGAEKTHARVAAEYYWPGIWHDVQRFVREYPDCQMFKVSQEGPQGLMGQRIVEQPRVVVAADCMEFPSSKNQCKHLVVFQDFFSRWIELKPIRSADGKSIAKAFEEHFLLTDNGKKFDNQHLKSTLEDYGVKHLTTPLHHPQANLVERSNRTLKTMIATFVKRRPPELRQACP